MKHFKVAGIQMACRAGNERHNLAKALRLVDTAAKKGASLVCLPELFSTGYDLDFIKKNARRWPDHVSRALGTKAKELV